MASEPVLDIPSLLVPIPGEQPAGENPRSDASPTSPYFRIKDLRAAARAAERRGEFGEVIGPTEASTWRPILDLGQEILRDRGKDLEVAAWMMEALLRTDGIAGLRDGMRLARGLVEAFWEDLHPMPDEDGIVTRVAPIAGLNGEGAPGTLVAPIARVPLTEGNNEGPFATWQCQQAPELAHLDDDRRRSRIEGGAVTEEQVSVAVRETPPAFFGNLREDLEECLAAWAELGSALDQRAGHDSPPGGYVREALQTCLETLGYVARDVMPVAEPEAVEEVAEQGGTADAAPGTAAPRPAGEIATREDAIQALAKLAKFFRDTEPHSPMPFLLERAVKWARLPLPELLQELIPDSDARGTYQWLTGMPKDDSDT